MCEKLKEHVDLQIYRFGACSTDTTRIFSDRSGLTSKKEITVLANYRIDEGVLA